MFKRLFLIAAVIQTLIVVGYIITGTEDLRTTIDNFMIATLFLSAYFYERTIEGKNEIIKIKDGVIIEQDWMIDELEYKHSKLE